MSIESDGNQLLQVVALLGAAVVMVPLFRRLGLGSVLGYLAAGLLIGPFGLGWFSDPEVILHTAELGVVMYLFVIGLEMQPAHLWGMRRQIFGLGSLQIGTAMLALTLLSHHLFRFSWPVAFVGAAGFVLTSTAIVMQLLGERGDLSLPRGQKIVAVLLFEDLLIVPLLAAVALMSPVVGGEHGIPWSKLGMGAAALAGLLAAGIWLLNPLFRILAAARAREVMTAAALLVVLGAALLMELGGLSMAMGAFLAGVLLSQSTFRHQIEAEIEPFRGILLGLFFLGVGMSLDLAVMASHWLLIGAGVVAMMLVKSVCVYAVARLTRSSHVDALDRAVLMAQGGEFAFVLFSAATAAKVVDVETSANLTAIVVLSMVLTPLTVLALRRYMPKAAVSMEGVEVAEDLSGSVLIIGFGRFGQVASQSLLARGLDVTIIDNDVEMIQSAATFGFKVYYGDGTRLDVLRACGADQARAIVICIDDSQAATRIVELVRHEFTQAKVLARAYDREHALKLVKAGVDYQIREMLESALLFGRAALLQLGVPAAEANEILEQVRRRDAERFKLELATDDASAGADLLIGNVPRPTPFTAPRHEGKALNEETDKAIHASQSLRE